MKEKPSLLIIGNSNVGKSSITRLLLPNPKSFKGKTGKNPGSTLLIKPIEQPNMPYKIVDLPGFGYMKHSSRRREDHVKKQIVLHVEKHAKEYFLGLVVINILRIEDEITKYFIIEDNTIPLSFELINFLREFDMQLIVIFNKIDKISQFDKNKLLSLFLKSAAEYGLRFAPINEKKSKEEISYIEFSALKKTNLPQLKRSINNLLNKK
ncbi:MAG: 50S ribosome-binding GTPase [Candidatus Lokiarchaeota archaeon]|nr:50S ribosome-binding GTPase [Candidatus Lokiarchaeota archaeon]